MFDDYIVDLELEVSDLQEEIDDLNDYIKKHVWIDNKFINTFVKITQMEFDEQLDLLNNLIESKERFSDELSYDKMLGEQRNNVYNLACCLLCLDRLKLTRNIDLYFNEIQNKYDEFPEPFEC